MPSTVTVHYPFHPLHCRCLEVVAWPRQPHLAVTVRQPDGQTLKIPLWMVEPAAAHCELRERVELTASVLHALIALLEHRPTVPATTPPEHTDAAVHPEPRRPTGHHVSPGTDIAHYALTAAAVNDARTVNAGHLEHAVAELRL